MSSERYAQLRLASGLDPVERLRQDLPPLWRGSVIGPGVAEWASLTGDGDRKLDLTDLPAPFAVELAWMAHWQTLDGTQLLFQAINQMATMLRRARQENHPVPASMREMDWDTASALQGWYYASRWGRLPSAGSRRGLRILTRFARLALVARYHDVPGGSSTTGTRAATPGSRSASVSLTPTTAAHPGKSPSPGCATRPNGSWARCWGAAPCAGQPSARADSSA